MRDEAEFHALSGPERGGGARPAVFAVPPGVPFAEAFAAGFRRRFAGEPPEAAARAEVLVNTRRSLRLLEEALADGTPAPAFLPRMALLSELGADPLAAPDLPPAVDPLRRRLRMIRLVEAWLDATEGASARAAAPDLADALLRLLDELDEEGVATAALGGIVPEDLARHWQQTLSFAALIRDAWPAVRAEAEGGRLDPKARQRLVIERLVADWADRPPAHPVIAAASTGSVASTATLLAAVARLPGGAVVLPGFDTEMAPEVWRVIAEGGAPEHPMAPFARVLTRLDLAPGEIVPWDEPRAPGGARRRLLLQALRPAPVTDAWVEALPRLTAEIGAAAAGLTLVEAPGQRQEAAAIALAIREALETPGRRIALVTPDATLARRVTVELARFGIAPDDSLGRPLSQSPAGIFARLVLRAAEQPGDPVALATLMQHPFCAPGLPRRDHRRHARRYERRVLRERPLPSGTVAHLPPWPPATDDRPGPSAEETAWLEAVEAPLAALWLALQHGALAGVVAAHRAALDALSREAPDAEPRIGAEADGAALTAFMARLARQADAHGDGPVERYPTLFAALLEGEQQRPDPSRPHPRVAIWGTMEARVGGADMMILGGLNEGVWPAAPGADPWLSRPMRVALGLAPPERSVGLSAHDFLQAACRPQVVLTRSTRLEGAPTVASRWLLRLENLMNGIVDGAALSAMRARGARLLALTALLHRPAASVPPAARPAPRPPAEARPRKLSATQIETLIRDPYAIYAMKVLRLRPLDPLGRPANALDRGSVIHAILERFVKATPDGLPPDGGARDLLLRIAAEVLSAEIAWPDIRRLWLGRVAQFADWFIEGEHERRQQGRPALIEASGALDLQIADGTFTVTARADRIDTLNDGGAAIFDYKAGAPPTARQIGLFNHQLHIQAAILMAGGFAPLLPQEAPVGAYIGLRSGPDGGEVRAAPNLADDLPDHGRRLAELLARYLDPATPFLSRARVMKDAFEGDYDHLARRWEWEAAE